MMRTLLALSFATGLFAADLQVGKKLTLTNQVTLTELMAKPSQFLDKTIQVSGKITEVCQMMGCWMMLTNDDGVAVRIQVQHGVVAFPKDASGRMATAEGKFVKFELTQEEAISAAKHEAEEQGRKFDPGTVKGSLTIYEIEGTGAVLR
jgi:hypothetical protein